MEQGSSSIDRDDSDDESDAPDLILVDGGNGAGDTIVQRYGRHDLPRARPHGDRLLVDLQPFGRLVLHAHLQLDLQRPDGGLPQQRDGQVLPVRRQHRHHDADEPGGDAAVVRDGGALDTSVRTSVTEATQASSECGVGPVVRCILYMSISRSLALSVDR